MRKNNHYRSFVTTIIVLLVISPLTLLTVEAQEENTWTSLTPLQKGRMGLGVATVNEKIYAIGGNLGTGYGELTVVDTNEEYDPTTNTWVYKTPMPTARSSFGIAVYKNKIYCFGGITGIDRTSPYILSLIHI